MSKTPLLLFAVFVMSGAYSRAQSTAESSYLVNSAELIEHDQLKIQFGAVSQTAADSSLGLRRDDQNNFKLAIDGSQKNSFGENSSSKISFRLQSLNSDGDLLLAVPEAFIQIDNVVLGRKKTAYSDIDRVFEMGILNPLLTADQVRAEQQGLTGLHFKKQWGPMTVGVSAVGVYLPNQAPGVKEENGQLVAANRWSATPPEKLRFNDELKDINYKITDIDYAKIANHQGYVTGLGWQFEQSAVKASYGRLPMNDVVISREIFADLQVRPQVNLTPVVTYQDVFTADFTFETGPILTTVGMIQSNPDNQAAAAKLETQKISASTTFAVMAEYPLHQSVGFVKSLSLAAAETRGGEIEDINSSGGKSDFILTPQRFKFNKPVQFKALVSLWESRLQKVLADVKFVYDREQKGSLLDTEVSYLTAMAGLTVNAGVTMVGVSDDNTDDKRFLFQSQVNDRVYGGLSYEF